MEDTLDKIISEAAPAKQVKICEACYSAKGMLVNSFVHANLAQLTSLIDVVNMFLLV